MNYIISIEYGTAILSTAEPSKDYFEYIVWSQALHRSATLTDAHSMTFDVSNKVYYIETLMLCYAASEMQQKELPRYKDSIVLSHIQCAE